MNPMSWILTKLDHETIIIFEGYVDHLTNDMMGATRNNHVRRILHVGQWTVQTDSNCQTGKRDGEIVVIGQLPSILEFEIEPVPGGVDVAGGGFDHDVLDGRIKSERGQLRTFAICGR